MWNTQPNKKIVNKIVIGIVLLLAGCSASASECQENIPTCSVNSLVNMSSEQEFSAVMKPVYKEIREVTEMLIDTHNNQSFVEELKEKQPAIQAIADTLEERHNGEEENPITIFGDLSILPEQYQQTAYNRAIHKHYNQTIQLLENSTIEYREEYLELFRAAQ